MANEYPIDALPETIRDAVKDVQAYTQASTALTAASALTAVSVAVQGLVNVRTLHRFIRPVSLFLLTVANSGEGKTTCDGFFTKPLREFEREEKEKNAPALRAYEAAMAAWSAEQRRLLKAIEALAQNGGSKSEATLSDKKAALVQLYGEKPEKPPVPRLLYSDATTEALAYSITHSWPSAGLVNSEAGTIFGGHSMDADTIMRNLAMLKQLWDGADFSVDRHTKESFSVRNVRLTVGLQVQPDALRKFMNKHGVLARGQGFLARFLLAFPESTQGERDFPNSSEPMPGLDAFQRRLRELLEIPLPLNKTSGRLELDLPVIKLTPEAFEVWVTYYNRTERRLKGDLQGLTDVGSRAAEQVARLAAVFQVFERGVTDIDVEYVERAAQIVDWHLLEAKRIYDEYLPQSSKRTAPLVFPAPIQPAALPAPFQLAPQPATSNPPICNLPVDDKMLSLFRKLAAKVHEQVIEEAGGPFATEHSLEVIESEYAKVAYEILEACLDQAKEYFLGKTKVPEEKADLNNSSESQPKIIVKRFSTLLKEIEETQWLWPGWLPRGSLVILAGSPGVGKTMVATSIAGAVSAGCPPIGEPNKPHEVLFFETEDLYETTIRSRLAAAGADLNRVRALLGLPNGEHGITKFNPATDADKLRELLLRLPEGKRPALIIFDSIVDVANPKDYSDAGIQRALLPYTRLARELNACVIGTVYFAKDSKGRLILDKKISLAGFTAAAEIAFIVEQKSKTQNSPERILRQIKNNLTGLQPAKSFQIKPAKILVENETIETAVIKWAETI